ncbi:MAG: MerR family transcriptional regulator [Acutalibacteraceae bacterium]|nr:MerR family transcriptional regulator [Clostridia bacterium]MEE3450767.1 MerR family transcriptional regulator [Acutalibacteraceae bacterium]
MMSVKQISEHTGISIRTLHYYDSIGLLKPTKVSESGYRYYDDTALERLEQILLFKELEFSLRDIKEILDAPNFDKTKALEKQIELLTMKKEHLENVIIFAKKLKEKGIKAVDFKVFDTKKLDEYSAAAKEQYGNTKEYKQFEEKQKNRTPAEAAEKGQQMMKLFEQLGEMKHLPVQDNSVQRQIEKIRDFISENFYDCSNSILGGLGKMYAAGGEFTENIDAYSGKGTAEFAAKAIEYFIQQ